MEEIKTGNGILVQESAALEPALLDELVKAGVLYGRKKSKTHPRMRQYIFTTRNGMEIIDVVQTVKLLDKAAEFLKTVRARGGLILFVGTAPAAKDIVKALAQKFKQPYVTERWLGGTLTNFKTIHERLQYYLKLKSDRETGRLEKYTKKERLDFDKSIERMTILFGGLELLTRLPDALVIVGSVDHETAVREARRLKIPMVALISTDANPDLIDYPIPGNDRARPSIEWAFQRLGKAIEEAKKETPVISNQ